MTEDLKAGLASLNSTMQHVLKRLDEATEDRRETAQNISEIKVRLTSLERDFQHSQHETDRVESTVARVELTAAENSAARLIESAIKGEQERNRDDLIKIIGISVSIASLIAALVTSGLSFFI